MAEILSTGHSIHFDTELEPLQSFITDKKYSKVFVFADGNTSEVCLPVFQSMLGEYTGFDLIETDPGEENKNIDFCIGIWKTLLDFEADRKSLMINLGGGVITDLGGFVASTYKRGIDFINIPTTLLSMVDASVGGKTGIDIDNVKNMIGTFSLPQAVFIESAFLKTLPERELLSGFAEMIKHGLIKDSAYFQLLKGIDYRQITAAHIQRSVEIKHEVVTEDPMEKGLRKILNFGHTIGHAIESYALSNDAQPLTHGEAIALGMICEAYLSVKLAGLPEAALEEITGYLSAVYPAYQMSEDSMGEIIALVKTDKKNEHGFVLCSLLSEIGNCTYNCKVTDEELLSSLKYLNGVFLPK